MFLQDHYNNIRAYDHLCRACLEELRVKEKRHPAEWGTALCKIINTSNGHAHLSRLHKHNEEVETYFSLKDNAAPRKSPSRASDDPHSPIKSTGVLSLAAKRNLQEQSRRLQAEWLNYNGIPHNVTRNPEFKKMFQICTNTFVPISPPTFIKWTVSMFEDMIKGIKRVTKECQLNLSPLKWATCCKKEVRVFNDY